MDTLPSPYYDMLVINAFVEFRDLMYFVGRIEDGIRRGKIVDTEASIQEKKMIIFNEHDGGLNKRKPNIIEESIGNLSRSLCTLYAWVPQVGLFCPKGLHENVVKSLIQAILGAIKENDQGVPFTSNDLRRVTPRTDPELWDFRHSRKA